jgi:hypothetical protein
MSDWRTWVPTNEAHARASGRRRYNAARQRQAQARREEVRQLLQRWGTSVAARVKIATLLHVSLRTVTRDMHALAERPPLPVLCPTCGLPSRLDVDPVTVADDPRALARLEQAMARLIGADQDLAPSPRQRSGVPAPRPERPQRHDRRDPKGLPFRETAPHA